MKAIVRYRYGSPDVLELADVEPPSGVPADAVLVRVHASSVNAFDWHMLRGLPYMARISEGVRRPKSREMGVDVAGVAEAVGHDVTHVKPGDAVFGARSGAFAEYVCGRNFVPMPAGLSFEEAAALPVAGCTALQAVRDKGRVRAGQRVLVNGAGGGVGSFAVQIAKAFGAEVTAVTTTTKIDLCRALGADRVIDYTVEDCTTSGRHDVVIDVGGNRRLSAYRRTLTAEGILVMVGPGRGQWLGPIAHIVSGKVRSRLGRQRMVSFLAAVNRDDLLVLKQLVEGGQLTPVVDRPFPLAEVPAAIRYVEEGRARGKVVVTIA